MDSNVSRRRFLGTGSVIALVPAAADAATRPAARHANPPAPRGGTTGGAADAYLYFNPAEAALVEAAAERLIPPDAIGPGALEAGVPHYIDLQLHGAWGAGERLYRAGPWQQGAPTQGYQLPFTPAELFRTALRGLADEVRKRHGTTFDKLSGAQQDELLTELQATSLDLAGVPSHVFFESLLAMCVEGYFSDPVYGGNRGMAAWRMIGFPGAYGSYHDLVDRHGEPFVAEPRSLAQDGRGHVHLMPDLPAGPDATSMPAMPKGGR